MLSSLSFASTSSRFRSADNVGRHYRFCTSPSHHHIEGCLWIGIAADLLYCFFIQRKTDCDQQVVDIFLQRFNGLCFCRCLPFGASTLFFDRKPSTVRHVRHPCSTEDTFPIFQIVGHFLQIMMISRKKCRMIIVVTSGTFRRFHTVSRIWRTFKRNATHGRCLH